MTSRHLVDPQLLAALDAMPTISLDAENLLQVRDMFKQMLAMMPKPPPSDDVTVSEHTIPGPVGAPPVRVLKYVPDHEAGAPLPGYLHIHGGGYVLGTADMSDAANIALAKSAGCVVVSVDYRLSPETPAPGGVEDCYAALLWVHSNAADLGVDPGRIAIGGESAGGGMAAALALLARDRGAVQPIFQLLTYPMLDDRTGTTPASAHPYAGEFTWTAESNRFGWGALLGHAPGGADASPYAAAARAASLEGLPPACIAVGALDLFLEENLEYARRLMRAGVPTELHVLPGAYHGFDLSAPDTAVAKQFRETLTSALKRALHKP